MLSALLQVVNLSVADADGYGAHVRTLLKKPYKGNKHVRVLGNRPNYEVEFLRLVSCQCGVAGFAAWCVGFFGGVG